MDESSVLDRSVIVTIAWALGLASGPVPAAAQIPVAVPSGQAPTTVVLAVAGANGH